MSENTKEYKHEWYLKNRDKLLAQAKKYNEEHPDEIKEYSQKYRKEHREELREKSQKYRAEHPEECRERCRKYQKSHKKERNEHQKQKRRTDVKFRINLDMTVAIWTSLKGNKKGRRWEDLVGYTADDLIKHLKKTLPKGYTWNDYLEGKLHIDHITPISIFNFTSPNHPDFKKCWALENLRLLPAKENLRKHNKLYKPFQPALELILK